MMQSSIAGIPCQVHVTNYEPANPGGAFEPPSGPEIEYEVYDRRGYKASWLLTKITDADDLAILNQHEASVKAEQDEACIGAYLDRLEAYAEA